MARKLHPASTPIDDRLFNELFFRQFLLDHPNPVVPFTTPSNDDEEFSVTHDLGRLPAGYLLIRSSEPVQLYDGTEPWDEKRLTLRATKGGVDCTIVVL